MAAQDFAVPFFAGFLGWQQIFAANLHWKERGQPNKHDRRAHWSHAWRACSEVLARTFEQTIDDAKKVFSMTSCRLSNNKKRARERLMMYCMSRWPRDARHHLLYCTEFIHVPRKAKPPVSVLLVLWPVDEYSSLQLISFH